MSAYRDAQADGFTASRERFDTVLAFLGGAEAAVLSHSQLEDRLDVEGRALLRQLLQDHVDLRALRESRVDVLDADGVRRTRVETGHTRGLATNFGEVTVARLAYCAPGHPNLHPADATLNLPNERHSHGLRHLAAVESARGSFDDAVQAINRATGQQVGKRQVEQLVQRTAVDFDDFYTRRRGVGGGGRGHDLLLSGGEVRMPTGTEQRLRPAVQWVLTASPLETRQRLGGPRIPSGVGYYVLLAPVDPPHPINPRSAAPPNEPHRLEQPTKP